MTARDDTALIPAFSMTVSVNLTKLTTSFPWELSPLTLVSQEHTGTYHWRPAPASLSLLLISSPGPQVAAIISIHCLQ